VPHANLPGYFNLNNEQSWARSTRASVEREKRVSGVDGAARCCPAVVLRLVPRPFDVPRIEAL